MPTISEWFKEAVPTPTVKNLNVQAGCHLEEFGEMLAAVKCNAASFDTLKFLVGEIARDLKTGVATIEVVDHFEMLDGLADQVVTATGLAHMLGYDFDGALNEVNDSNFSKFVNGKAVFDANGKISKGPDYWKPELTRFLPNT